MRFPSVEQVGCEPRQVQELRLPRVGQSPVGPVHTVLSDRDGNLYLSDEFNHSIISVDSAGALRWRAGGRGSGLGQFAYPRGLALGRLSRGTQKVCSIAVADAWNRRVQFFDLNGQYMESWHEFNGVLFGEVPDVRFLPADDAKGSDQGVWLVLDRGNHRICLYDEAGGQCLQIGRPLAPAISSRWSLPGCHASREIDNRQWIPEFESLDHLYFPSRLLGYSEATLHVWEPLTRNLKRLLFGQLIPVSKSRADSSEWICASGGSLIGWDATNRRVMLCERNGEPTAGISVPGVPVASNLPAGEVWIQLGESLQRLVVSRPEKQTSPQDGNPLPAAESYGSKASLVPEADSVLVGLARASQSMVDLVDESLSPSPTTTEGSVRERLQVLTAEMMGIKQALLCVMHPWSVAVLRRRLSALAGEPADDEIEWSMQWLLLAERLKSCRDGLRERCDAVFAASRGKPVNCTASPVPENIRRLLGKLKTPLSNLMALHYRLSVDFRPSDRLLHRAGVERTPRIGSPALRAAARLRPLVPGNLVPGRVLKGGFRRPGRIALAGFDCLWVADFGEKALYRLRGEEKVRIGPDQLRFPRGMVLGDNGLMVGDREARCIWHINGKDSCSKVLDLPRDEVMALAASPTHPLLYVGTFDPLSVSGRILILDTEWRIVGEVSQAGGKHLGMPLDLAMTPDGRLVLVDWHDRSTVRVLTSDGKSLGELVPNPMLPQEWTCPHGVCVGKDGSIFVSDYKQNCIRWYSPDLKDRLTFGRGILSEPAGVVMRGDALLVSNAGTGEIIEFPLEE